jgi:branched-subunit amino acid transport protein
VRYVDDVLGLDGILGCGVVTLPLKYLDLPFGASYKAIHIPDVVIEKIESHLSSWKMLYLSKSDKITLIKSSLSNLPTYFMTILSLPPSIVNRIEKL